MNEHNITSRSTEVSSKLTRSYFRTATKLRILAEADAAPDQLPALLRREGLYSQQLDDWRKEFASKRKAPDSSAKRIADLERENERLKKQLGRAEAVLDIQKKMAEFLKISDKKNEKP